MILWRGRLVFREYIKNNRHKYSIKLYMLTELDGFILRFMVYAGADDETGGPGHMQNLVMSFLEGRLQKGHHIYG